MSGNDSGVGVAGSSFTHYVYPGIYESQVRISILSLSVPKLSWQDFHYCGLEPGNNIVNYDNRLEVQTCQLDNLAEYASTNFFFLGWLLNLTWFASSLGTDTEYVRSRLAEYANDLLSLGVDGFRLDAAKSKGLNKIKSWWPYVESLLDIAATDIANITSRFSSSKIYITQEVIFGAGQPILPSEYVGIGEFSVHPC